MMKNHIHKLLFLLLIGLLPVFNSCKEKVIPQQPCTEESTVKQSEELKAFFHFKTGSWWVYQNLDDTTIQDSIWIKKSEETTQNNINKNGDYSKPFCYELLQMIFQSRQNYYEPYEKTQRLFIEFSSTPDNVYGHFVENTLNNQVTGYYFNFKNDSMISLVGYSGIDFIKTQDTTINSIQYHNVISFFYPKGMNQNTFYNEVSYVKNIGPIYFEQNNGSRWQLSKYSVIQ